MLRKENWSRKKKSGKQGGEGFNSIGRSEICHSQQGEESRFDLNSKDDDSHGAQRAPEHLLPGDSAGEPGQRVQLCEMEYTIRVVYTSSTFNRFCLSHAQLPTSGATQNAEI